jgi:hypothetical protein
MKIRYKKIKRFYRNRTKKIADGNLRIFRLAGGYAAEFSKTQLLMRQAWSANTAKGGCYCCIGTNVCYD